MIRCSGDECPVTGKNICCVECKRREKCENKCGNLGLNGTCSSQIIDKEVNEI